MTPRTPRTKELELSQEEPERLLAFVDDLAILVADLWFDGKLDDVLAEDDDLDD
jgi:hypothetical protein